VVIFKTMTICMIGYFLRIWNLYYSKG